MNTNILLKRIIIFITIAVFTVTSHCSVLAYDGAAADSGHSVIPQGADTAVSKASGTPEVTYANEGYEFLEADDPAIKDLIKDIPRLEAPKATVFLTSTGIKIYWTEVPDAEGYKIYRLESGSTEWKEISDEDKATIRLTDKKLTNGKEYTYAVCAYQDVKVDVPIEEPEPILPPEDTGTTSPPETGLDDPDEPETPDPPEPPKTQPFLVTLEGDRVQTESVFWLSPSKITDSYKSGTTMTAAWETNEQAVGYQVEYANNRFFEGASALTMNGAYATSITLNGLKASSDYYVRVRGYAVHNGVTQYAPWALSSNAKATKTAKATVLKKKLKKKKKQKKQKKIVFELRGQAGYKVGKFDTLQGGCTDGKYGYFVLYNRNTQKCRIVKVNMSNMKITKKSAVMKIYHGNDMTYNPDTNRLIVIYGEPYYKKFAIVDPKTLKIVEKKSLELPEQLPGMTEKNRTAYTGITSIAYNTKYKQYVARIQKHGHLLIFDQNFTPVRYIYLSKKDGQTYQGMDAAGDYILVGQSFASGKPYNIITVYDWNGDYISKVNVRKGYELENVFHAGDVFYSGFYASGYKTVYVKKYRTKKVRGKTRRVKVKVKQRQLSRNNYIYKVTNL